MKIEGDGSKAKDNLIKVSLRSGFSPPSSCQQACTVRHHASSSRRKKRTMASFRLQVRVHTIATTELLPTDADDRTLVFCVAGFRLPVAYQIPAMQKDFAIHLADMRSLSVKLTPMCPSFLPISARASVVLPCLNFHEWSGQSL